MNKQDKEALKNEAKNTGKDIGREVSQRILSRFIGWVRERIQARRARRDKR